MITRSRKETTGSFYRAKTWRGHGTIKFGTWNVRGIAGKELEIVEEMKKASAQVVAMTETKKKGTGCIDIENGFIMIYSGVATKERAKAGVAFVVHKDITTKIEEWKCVNERIAILKLSDSTPGNKWTLIATYGPNEDALVEEKENYFELLQKVVDEEDGDVMILGDLNGRVGNRNEGIEKVLGPYGESVRNDNGKRILQFCVANELTVLNTRFPHKMIHKITREEPSRGEKSIIDYIICKRNVLPRIRDTKVKRGPEIGSDHYLLIVNISVPDLKKQRKRHKKKVIEKIKSFKLKNEDVQKEFASRVEEERNKLGARQYTDNLEEAWKNFRTVVINAAVMVCGKAKCGRRIKRTRWWTQEVREEVKKKKELWRRYLEERSQENHEAYKDQRKKAKEKVIEAKGKTWKEFGEFMEREAKTNQKLFYKVLKNMRKDKECPIKFIKGKEGKIIRNPAQILERWREYFRELLNGADPVGDRESGQGRREQGSETQEGAQGDEDPIEKEEMWDALGKMKLGKSAGHDGISPEMLRHMGGVGEDLLFRVIELAWNNKQIPKDWEVSIIVPIFKKGDERNCANHRGISLLSVPGKIYTRILENRLRKEVEHQLEEEQSGFRPGRGTQDHIFTLRQICEKSMEYGKSVYLCFVDLEKAFDRISWETLWSALRNKKVNEALICRMKTFYMTCRNYVRTANQQSAEFITRMGVRQGDIASPLYFICLMDEVLKEYKRRARQTKLGYWKLRPTSFSILAFADDLVLIADSGEKLQENINILTEELKKRDMIVNTSKTKCMAVSRNEEQLQIEIDGIQLEQVSVYKYLGVMLNECGKLKNEINVRVDAAGRLFHAINRNFLSKREVSKDTKMAVFRSTFVPTLTYGSESWALRKAESSQLQAAEMRYLRKVEGKTRRDKIRNTTIRNTLKTEPISEVVGRSQLRWFGHVCRMSDERYPKKAYETRMTGKRPRGRKRMTWEDNLREVISKRGIRWEEANNLARDRSKWCSFCKPRHPRV